MTAPRIANSGACANISLRGADAVAANKRRRQGEVHDQRIEAVDLWLSTMRNRPAP